MVSTPWNGIWSYRPDTALQSPLKVPQNRPLYPCQSLLKAQPPPPAARQADDVVVVAAVAEIGDHDNVIARSPPLPAVVGQDPATLVDVMDVDVLPAQSSRDAGAVQPQRDQVAVKVHDSAVPLTPVPVEGHGVAEASGLHELLPLEKHRDAGGRQQNPRGQGWRFWACHPTGSHGLISWARRAFPLPQATSSCDSV